MFEQSHPQRVHRALAGNFKRQAVEVVGEGVNGQNEQEETEHPLQARDVRAPYFREERRVDVRELFVRNEPVAAIDEAVRPVIAFLLEDVVVLALIFYGIADVLVLFQKARRHGGGSVSGGDRHFREFREFYESLIFGIDEGVERNEIVVYALPVNVRRNELRGGAERQENQSEDDVKLLRRRVSQKAPDVAYVKAALILIFSIEIFVAMTHFPSSITALCSMKSSL